MKENKKLIAKVSLIAASAATIGATCLIDNTAQAQQRCVVYGNLIYCSDGYSGAQYGNTFYGNDGYRSSQYGNTYYGNDGYRSSQYGNTNYGNDGYRYGI